jgi:hypothetical protein
MTPDHLSPAPAWHSSAEMTDGRYSAFCQFCSKTIASPAADTLFSLRDVLKVSNCSNRLIGVSPLFLQVCVTRRWRCIERSRTLLGYGLRCHVKASGPPIQSIFGNPKKARPIREPSLSREGAAQPRIGRVGVLEKVLTSIPIINPPVNRKMNGKQIFFSWSSICVLLTTQRCQH